MNKWKSEEAVNELKYTRDLASPSVATILSLFLGMSPLCSFLLALLIHLSNPLLHWQLPLLSFRRNILHEASRI
jgi:hypothetical protein